MGRAGLSRDLGDSGAWGGVRGAALRGMLFTGRRGCLGSGCGPRAQLTGWPACASCSRSSLGCPTGAPGSRRGAAPAGGPPGSQASDPVASRPRALVPPVHTAAVLRLQPGLCVQLPGVSWRPWLSGHHVGPCTSHAHVPSQPPRWALGSRCSGEAVGSAAPGLVCRRGPRPGAAST